MKKAALLSKLQFITTKQVGLELYFLYKPKGDEPTQILRANLDGTAAQAKLEGVFISKIKKQFFGQDDDGRSLDNSPDWSLKHIKDVDELKNTYYYFPNEDSESDDYHIPEQFNEMENLQNLLFENVPPFEFDAHLMDDVFAFLVRLQIDDEQVIFYKHKYPFDVLSRSTVLKIFNTTVAQHKTRFSLESDPLLSVNDKIDFMFIDNTFVILNLPLLESRYGFNERYLKNGVKSLEIIKKKNILSSTKIFDEMVKNVSFSKKLMRVKSDNEVLKTPIAEIKTFLEDYKTKDGKHSLAKRIKFLPTKIKFEVTTKVGAEDFLRLLNDQYLISLLTKKPYISDVQSEFEIKDEKEKVEKKAKVKKKATVS